MIVVADTSVILNLCRIEQEHLLQQLFQRVLIPIQVAEEFTRLAKVQARFAGLILPGWVEILPAPQKFPTAVIRAGLDPGESAAIALCLAQKADALLIDEKNGRKIAVDLGIEAVGILGVLIDARNEKLIPGVEVLLDRLQNEANFWITPDLRRHILQLAGE